MLIEYYLTAVKAIMTCASDHRNNPVGGTIKIKSKTLELLQMGSACFACCNMIKIATTNDYRFGIIIFVNEKVCRVPICGRRKFCLKVSNLERQISEKTFFGTFFRVSTFKCERSTSFLL